MNLNLATSQKLKRPVFANAVMALGYFGILLGPAAAAGDVSVSCLAIRSHPVPAGAANVWRRPCGRVAVAASLIEGPKNWRRFRRSSPLEEGTKQWK